MGKRLCVSNRSLGTNHNVVNGTGRGGVNIVRHLDNDITVLADLAVLEAFRKFDTILGCLDVDAVPVAEEIPAEVTALAEQRAAARKAKDFAESDRLRDEIAKLGYIIKDAPGGVYELKKA